MRMRGKTLGVLGLGLGAWLMVALPASSQQPAKPTQEEINKARDEVKKLTQDLSKLQDEVYEAQRRLGKAYDRLDELEGRRPGGFGPRGGFGGFGRGGFGPDFRRPDPPKTPEKPPATGTGDLEKRLEKILKDIEELRRDLKRP